MESGLFVETSREVNWSRLVKAYERFLYLSLKYPMKDDQLAHPTYAIDLVRTDYTHHMRTQSRSKIENDYTSGLGVAYSYVASSGIRCGYASMDGLQVELRNMKK